MKEISLTPEHLFAVKRSRLEALLRFLWGLGPRPYFFSAEQETEYRQCAEREPLCRMSGLLQASDLPGGDKKFNVQETIRLINAYQQIAHELSTVRPPSP
jgi:hypothetical protein